MTTHIISALIVAIFFANTLSRQPRCLRAILRLPSKMPPTIQRMTHRKIATRNYHTMPCTPPVIHGTTPQSRARRLPCRELPLRSGLGPAQALPNPPPRAPLHSTVAVSAIQRDVPRSLQRSL